jgi:hypothetical protein
MSSGVDYFNITNVFDEQRINRSDPIATASKLNKSARQLHPKSLTTKTPQH